MTNPSDLVRYAFDGIKQQSHFLYDNFGCPLVGADFLLCEIR